ncbi:MAG: HEAT repeat domain-containing protein [Pirellulales bacterium]
MIVRDELHRILSVNFGKLWIPADEALQELEHFGDDLIPGIIDCLTDPDDEIRRLAVTLLAEARPRSNVAVPKLIELLNDDDLLVKVAVLTHIAEFGSLAVGAIPLIEPFLVCDHEYLRTVAATAIVSLDPSRTELLPEITRSMQSDNKPIRNVAREFLAKKKASLTFDEQAFQEAVRGHWNYHALSEQVCWKAEQDEKGVWQCEITPVMQDIFGGEDDGKRVWSGFEFHLSGFSHEPGVELLDYGAASRCDDDTPIPFLGIEGRYYGESFVLRVGLEPLPNAEVREIVDVVRQVVRPVTDEEDE